MVTRSGSPLSASDLRRVAAGSASRVLLLHPDDSDQNGVLSPDEAKAVTLLGLKRCEGAASGSRVIVQMVGAPEDDIITVAARQRGIRALGSVGQVDGHWALGRQMAQARAETR